MYHIWECIVSDIQLLACINHRKMLMLIKMLMISVDWSRAAGSSTVTAQASWTSCLFSASACPAVCHSQRRANDFPSCPSQACVVSLDSILTGNELAGYWSNIIRQAFQGKYEKCRKGRNDAGMTRSNLYADCDERKRRQLEAFAFSPLVTTFRREERNIKC